MSQRLFVLSALFFLLSGSAAAGDVRIALLSMPDSDPAANEVAGLLAEQLTRYHLSVDLVDAESAPENHQQWIENASRAGRAKPGMLALFSYSCTASQCRVLIVEPRKKTVLELTVSHFGNRAPTVAAAIREALMGPLFPELERLSVVGKAVHSASKAGDVWWQLSAEEQRRYFEPTGPKLWIEGGYQGETAFHGGGPTGGPWVGARYEPLTNMTVDLSVGWLGFEEATAAPGTVRTNRLTTAISVSFVFPLGPAYISISPICRLDAVFSKTMPADSSDTKATDLEIQLGGMVSWHLPIMENLKAVVGIGLLGLPLSKDYGIETTGQAYDDMIPASVLRMFWIVGVGWSPVL